MSKTQKVQGSMYFFRGYLRRFGYGFPVLSLTPTFFEPITPSQGDILFYVSSEDQPGVSLSELFPESRQLFRQPQDVQVTKNQPGDLLPHSIYLLDGMIILIKKKKTHTCKAFQEIFGDFLFGGSPGK